MLLNQWKNLMSKIRMDRRRFLTGLVPAAGALALTGCDGLSETPWFRDMLASSEELTIRVQRFFLSPDSLAREFAETDISSDFRANGSTNPSDPQYRTHAASNFVNWRLSVGGLVEKPAKLSLWSVAATEIMPSKSKLAG